jgi:hypothetical protein
VEVELTDLNKIKESRSGKKIISFKIPGEMTSSSIKNIEDEKIKKEEK